MPLLSSSSLYVVAVCQCILFLANFKHTFQTLSLPSLCLMVISTDFKVHKLSVSFELIVLWFSPQLMDNKQILHVCNLIFIPQGHRKLSHTTKEYLETKTNSPKMQISLVSFKIFFRNHYLDKICS